MEAEAVQAAAMLSIVDPIAGQGWSALSPQHSLCTMGFAGRITRCTLDL
jgi:hypothetical protein